MNLFTNETNYFLGKTKSLVQLPKGAILCTVDVVDI